MRFSLKSYVMKHMKTRSFPDNTIGMKEVSRNRRRVQSLIQLREMHLLRCSGSPPSSEVKDNVLWQEVLCLNPLKVAVRLFGYVQICAIAI